MTTPDTAAEEWRPVVEPGYEDFYEVSSYGRVRSLDRHTERGFRRGRVLKPLVNRNGRRCVVLYAGGTETARKRFIYRLVAGAFLPNPDGLPEVDHLDADCKNDHVSNLEWVTHAENQRRRHERARARQEEASRGEGNSQAKITERGVRKMRRLAASDREAAVRLGEDLGLSRSAAYSALNGLTWSHLPPVAAPEDPPSLDGEEWRAVTVPGFEETHEVSSLGRVRSVARETPGPFDSTRRKPAKVLTLLPRTSGPVLNLYARKRRAQTRVIDLVAGAFLPEPSGECVASPKNDDPTDLRAENVEWVAVEPAPAKPAPDRPPATNQTKLDDEVVVEMRRLAQDDPSAAVRLGVSRGVTAQAARYAISGRTWRHLPLNP